MPLAATMPFPLPPVAPSPVGADLEALPDPPPAAVAWLLAGLLLLWLTLRVGLLRRQLEGARAQGLPPPTAPPWLLALARRGPVLVLLLLGVGGCVVGLLGAWR